MKNWIKLQCWLPIIRTLANSTPRANSNPNRFPLDFLHIFTVILPSVTRTLLRLFLTWREQLYTGYPPTRSNFCFPFGHFYTILPSITRTMFYSAWQVEKKKKCTEVRNTRNSFHNNQVTPLSLLLCHSSSKFSVHPACILIKLYCLIPLFKKSIDISYYPPCPFAYFLISGYLLQTPNNWTFFQFS